MERPRSERSWLGLAEGCSGGRHYQYTDIDPPPSPCRRRARLRVVALALGLGAAVAWGSGITLPRSGATGPATLELNTGLPAEVVQSKQSVISASNVVSGTEGDVHDDAEMMAVRVWNSYMLTGERIALYPWLHVAEPHRRSVMEVSSWPQVHLEEDTSFRWTVGGVVLGTGDSITTTFLTPGVHECSVTSFRKRSSPMNAKRERGSHTSRNLEGGGSTAASPTADEDLQATFRFEVTVKYVRREIRDLTDRDREIFFNAVSILQRVPSAVGREVYGKKYYSKDYFNRLHLYYGGQKDCDHWHDGPGFVTSHIAISLMYEQALQTVNPSIALPYWDFTIEGTAYDWTNFRDSGVFSDDWFGDAAPRNPLMTPDRGRFGYVPAMTNASEYSNLYNPYGLLRSPWNTDPNPFLTRHDHVFGYVNNRKPSGCRQYKDALDKNSWMTLTDSMNEGAHGHIHELLGGAWSSEWSGFYNRTDDIVLPFTHVTVPLMKRLWRAGYIVCPEWCGIDQLWEDCRCSQSTEAISGKTPAEVLEDAGVLSDAAQVFFYDRNLKLVDNLADREGHAYSPIPGYTVEETDDIYAEMLRVLCTPMKIGAHYEATSTNDITFWVLHTTFDRLWHLSRLQRLPDFDETWTDDSTCYGHNPTDVQPFHNLFLKSAPGSETPSRAGKYVEPMKVYYTNEILYELLKPDGLATPYVYDQFLWVHCEAIGIFMHGHGTDDPAG